MTPRKDLPLILKVDYSIRPRMRGWTRGLRRGSYFLYYDSAALPFSTVELCIVFPSLTMLYRSRVALVTIRGLAQRTFLPSNVE